MHKRERRSRPDRAKELIVNDAIDMVRLQGRSEAAKFLEQRDVPLRVIARVLNEPDRRRPH